MICAYVLFGLLSVVWACLLHLAGALVYIEVCECQERRQSINEARGLAARCRVAAQEALAGIAI